MLVKCFNFVNFLEYENLDMNSFIYLFFSLLAPIENWCQSFVWSDANLQYFAQVLKKISSYGVRSYANVHMYY